jgi:basic membrane lipoprotein Med (substrate-binding protein (PBP1-ABC) superfamily)
MDMSIFVNAKAVWVYQSGSWQAYSPNSTLAASLVEKGVSVLTSVDANSAMWVER